MIYRLEGGRGGMARLGMDVARLKERAGSGRIDQVIV